jgi:hypothetical protein
MAFFSSTSASSAITLLPNPKLLSFKLNILFIMHFLSLVSTLAIAAFASAAPPPQKTPPVSIKDKAFDTCGGWSSNGAVISANCANGSGGNTQSELYLGNCFVNNGGVLTVSPVPIMEHNTYHS